MSDTVVEAEAVQKGVESLASDVILTEVENLKATFLVGFFAGKFNVLGEFEAAFGAKFGVAQIETDQAVH